MMAAIILLSLVRRAETVGALGRQGRLSNTPLIKRNVASAEPRWRHFSTFMVSKLFMKIKHFAGFRDDNEVFGTLDV